VQAQYNLGVEYFQLNRLEEAAAAFARAIELEPGYENAHRALAQLYGRQGNREESVKYLAQARDLEQTARRRTLGRSAMPWATGVPLGEAGKK
jgi:tetratricopeptide (TPR) repeat protein